MDRALLKADAKAAIRESKTSPYLTALIYVVIAYVLGLLQSKITGIEINYNVFYNALESGNYDYLFNTVQQQSPSFTAQVIGTLLSIMSMMVSVGFTIFTLKVSRRQENSLGNLFDGFGEFFRILWLYILMGLFIFLWSLLFVIPGIIAAYRYRQSIYLLIDNPDMRAIECIRRSKQMMRGHKMELFVLDLSFIGWYLLTIIPFVSIYVYPYANVTYAAYYNTFPNEGSGSNRYGKDSKGDLPPWEFRDR